MLLLRRRGSVCDTVWPIRRREEEASGPFVRSFVTRAGEARGTGEGVDAVDGDTKSVQKIGRRRLSRVCP